MRQFIKENWFKISLLLILIYLLFFTNQYLNNKNELDARNKNAICFKEAITELRLGAGMGNFEAIDRGCAKILDYKNLQNL